MRQEFQKNTQVASPAITLPLFCLKIIVIFPDRRTFATYQPKGTTDRSILFLLMYNLIFMHRNKSAGIRSLLAEVSVSNV
jgi:hypothetical protein